MTDDLLDSEVGQVALIVKSVNIIAIFKYQCLILLYSANKTNKCHYICESCIYVNRTLYLYYMTRPTTLSSSAMYILSCFHIKEAPEGHSD